MKTKFAIKDDCLCLKLTGSFDADEAKEIIGRIAEELHARNFTNFFLDITEAKGLEGFEKPVRSIYDVSLLLSSSLPKATKISLLGTKEQIGFNSYFRDFMMSEGFSVKLATGREESLKWPGASLDKAS
jgi:hypothetical protein